ncbi:MAG: MarR family transcriptional regulator, partial [Proteobacteria bacterium]|nr:MarR family transcriptional regulator [Pseudomonadota bacterium]
MANSRKDLKLNDFLPYVMSNLADNISAELSTIYAQQHGLTTTQWRVLANLAQHRTLTAREIVSFTALEKTKVSRAVSGLTERGLLSQTRTEGDSRSKDLNLTEAGVGLYQAIVPKVLNWERELLDCLSSGEYRDLMYLLEKLKLQLARRSE